MEFHHIVDYDLEKTKEESDGDDTFYAELESRILVLINTGNESNSKDSRTIRTNNYSSYFDRTETESPAVPTTILNLWRSNVVNVTGVFIPHMAKSERRNKHRGIKVRMEKSNGK